MKKNQTKNGHFIILTTGKDTQGKDFWSYLAVPFHRYEAYKIAITLENIDLADYGQVLAYGEGKAPSDALRKQFINKYKLMDDFENTLAELGTILQD